MATPHHSKALIISPWWAGIFASAIVAGMTGLFVFVWNANAQAAVSQQKIETLQDDMKDIKDAKIEPRLSRIETKLDMLLQKVR